MTIVTILVMDPRDPVEVQTWLDAHPIAVISNTLFQDHTFYIFYT